MTPECVLLLLDPLDHRLLLLALLRLLRRELLDRGLVGLDLLHQDLVGVGDVTHDDEAVQQLGERAGGEEAVDDADVAALLVEAAGPLRQHLLALGQVLPRGVEVALGLLDKPEQGVETGVLNGDLGLRGGDLRLQIIQLGLQGGLLRLQLPDPGLVRPDRVVEVLLLLLLGRQVVGPGRHGGDEGQGRTGGGKDV